MLVRFNSEVYDVIFSTAFLSLRCHLIKYYHGSSLIKSIWCTYSPD